MAAQSLLQRALTDLDRGPEDIVELFGPGNVRDLAIAMLSASGCALDGSPADVERLVKYATEVDVEPWLREWRKSFGPANLGRPRTDLFEIVIYAAARHRFGGEHRNPAALAAKWLGEPATKDKVEKREKRFRRIFSHAYVAYAGLSRAEAAEHSARILLDVILDLEKLDAKMAAERVATSHAKRDSRHAPFSARIAPAP
ncbi:MULTISPECIES: hypothetical protein [unclassified Mesorhizobium]|uniref:hypothetical protein n=1 Tax=unclassified Mesorhizobium TaxID=325217 RepID=UPI000FCC610D|nr:MULTISPECIES: hypothetical protein [unclassified Mesorhizobium]RUV42701.1 hypothetical protein EOD29_19790 [Mesorhizobium sp. M1A.T.Ca.IN.004.03.1.1]RWK37290.1 MAG: hypothetical protein EOR40_12840 [Mesorhizobium sp.]RWK85820.1 MAG: hypothetical protein EOR52_25570 [Mesorhizobium sp.]TIP19551.1 MAG: hypothetical protein E5X66_12655 [Mesorhizobium sp.]TJV85739.1 MAG: hypothetical protein E5X45_02695 [Mesorhizobium sp.]